VILDLDNLDALSTAINVLEVRPNTGIIGVTGSADLNHAIAAQRAGCRQIVTRPIDAHDLNLAIRRALSHFGEEVPRCKSLALMGATGGAGATMVACHLAVELAAISHARCELIDLDLEFGGVARAFDLAPQLTIAELAKAGALDELLMRKTV